MTVFKKHPSKVSVFTPLVSTISAVRHIHERRSLENMILQGVEKTNKYKDSGPLQTEESETKFRFVYIVKCNMSDSVFKTASATSHLKQAHQIVDFIRERSPITAYEWYSSNQLQFPD